ncbi:MAG: hypothetical protein ACYC3I_06670 [Gemmataceae bacterium]
MAVNFKEFDYKQFLLEKGERVGLGVAVALMVLMLVFSLFMPSKGFFSGSPAAKAKELKGSTDQLETAMRTKTPGSNDLPEKGEDRLIKLDTTYLQPEYYKTEGWFEPLQKDNKMRRPPKILNVEEAVAEVAAVPIDTYLFRFDSDPVKILVLRDKDRRNTGGGGAGGNIPFTPRRGGNMPNMPGGGSGSMMFQNQQRQLGSNFGSLQSLQGGGAAADNPEYDAVSIPADTWNPQQDLTARQLRPLRMTIIGGSFPYRRQLEEHKSKLHHPNLDAVLAEEIIDGDKKTDAFRFLGVEVQRVEVDATGKKLGDWSLLPLKETYQLWLQNTYFPLEKEDPKYEPILVPGLWVPLLREFHARKPDAAAAMQGFGSMGSPKAAGREEAAAEEPKTKYPDVVKKLPKLQESLEKLRDVQPKQIAAPKFRHAEIANLFNLEAPPNDNNKVPANPPGGAKDGQESSVYPEYVFVRVVDVNNIVPGKYYRYRMRIKMANPNYKRLDVAAPDYKENEELTSNDWFEIDQNVTPPPEEFHYVVDEAKGLKQKDFPKDGAQSLMWAPNKTLAPDQVVFQFHRWVESLPLSKRELDVAPIGDWVIADRVFVARGEYVGRKVKVDVPVWQYVRNAFILPTEEKTKGPGRKKTTGIEVDFGHESPENNAILVDFEGGRVNSPLPNIKVADESGIEVLMLSPDGKLLARNSALDTDNTERKERRKEVLKRIQDTREGKGTE